MMMMSAFIASRFFAVSLSVSPFFSEEASAVKLMMSAVRRWAASSKLMRVRVEGSMKRFTTVLPRSAGTFLMARAPTALKARAVSSTVLISSAVSDSMSSKCLRFQLMNGSGFLEVDRIFLGTGLGEVDANILRGGGGDILADEIGLDRQFAMAAIDQHRKLNPLGPAEIIER